MKKHFTDIPIIIREFLTYMETIKGKSPRTVNEYYLDLRYFFRFLYMYKLSDRHALDDDFDKIDISGLPLDMITSVTLSDIYEFLIFKSRDKNNTSATIARKVSSLRSFYKYLFSKAGIIDKNPTEELDSPKIRKNLPKYLSIDESMQLLASVDGKHKERDFAIITIFLNCGLRLSELISIDFGSIKGRYMNVLGKGNKERTVYLNDACAAAVETYIKVRPRDGVKDRSALFLSERGRRISRRTVQYIIEKFVAKSGLDPSKYTTHKLRHTAATLMYQNGVDVRVLQEILGHANLGTTQIYTHLSDESVKQALSSNPLSNIKPDHRQNEDEG